jgi:hypothetical protein
MAEFYVTYNRDGQRYVAVVIAPARPSILEFTSREELHAAMDALGHSWQLQNEIHGNVSSDWLEQMAKVGALKPVPRPSDSIFSFGSIPFSGVG